MSISAPWKGPKSVSKWLRNQCSFSESSEIRFVYYLLYFSMTSPSEKITKTASFSESVSVPHSESLLRVLKCNRKAPRQEKKSKKVPKTGPSWPGKSLPRGWTNASRGHLFTFGLSDVLSLCTFLLFTSCMTSRIDTFGTKSEMFLIPVVAYVKHRQTWKKTTRVPPPYLIVTGCSSDARGTGFTAFFRL